MILTLLPKSCPNRFFFSGGSDASDMEDNDSLSPPIKGFNVGKLPHQQLSNSSDPNSTSVMSTLQQQQSSRKRKLTTGSDSGVVLSGHPLNSRLSGQAAALGTPGGTDSPRKRLRTEPSSEDHPDFSVDEPPTMVCRTGRILLMQFSVLSTGGACVDI